MNRKGAIFSGIMVLVLVDIFYILMLYKINNYINLDIMMNYDKVLFRLIYVLNLLLISFVISSIINKKKDVISIRPVRIENNTILFTSQTKKNIEMYTDLQRYYIYETSSKKFIIDKFYIINRNKYGELKKSKKKGFPEAYDLHKYKLKDFR